ncbi:MAG: 4'-phosphopantetheinyl transferase superfamily protein [Candidatus Eisenbacteria bacterium]
MILGLGIDLFPVGRLQRELERWGSEFLEEFLSDAELHVSAAEGWAPTRLAATFAGKEAVFKALGTGRTPEMRWADIEILPLGSDPGSTPLRPSHLFASYVHPEAPPSGTTLGRPASSSARLRLHGAVRTQALSGLTDRQDYRLSLELDFFGDHARAIAIAESSPHRKGGLA